MSSGLRVFAMALVLSLSSACPSSCSCKWKNGKQTVECINKDLLVIPEGMDSGTQVLEFCGNNLQTLHRDKFLKMDLINLQRIYLCRCRILTIDERTFKGLTNLVELDLSGNLLEAIPTATFLDCPSLMRLTLNSNPIQKIHKSAFNQLSLLSTLELASCQITTVEEGAFQGLFSLEWLHLDANRLSTLPGAHHLPDSLKGVQLQDNPWQCDCHLLGLHAWLRAFPIPHSVEPICSGPQRLRARTIKSVPVGELACLPEVSPTTFYLEIGEGKNVSLVCQVHAVPEARISWTLHGQLLQNDSTVAPGVHLVYFVEEAEDERRSELFIYNTNTEDNGTFVCNAENPAGVAQANFTIRIVVKERVVQGTTELPFEFVLVIMAAAAISVLLLMLVLTLSVVRCQRNARMKKKRNHSKATITHSTKDNLLPDAETDYTDTYKESVSIKMIDHEEDMIRVQHNEEFSPGGSPTPLSTYHLEQNPDLINGTESVGRFPAPCRTRQDANPNELYVYASDVHLNPVGLLNPGEARSQPCYKTLPYNRASKARSTAANPMGRFSREAEFLSRTQHPASYEHYSSDVRYTADGYPVRTSAKSDAACCSTAVTWPACLPAGMVLLNECGVKSVGAQTQTEDTHGSKPITGSVKVAETLTESLDEGYEGESSEQH